MPSSHKAMSRRMTLARDRGVGHTANAAAAIGDPRQRFEVANLVHGDVMNFCGPALAVATRTCRRSVNRTTSSGKLAAGKRRTDRQSVPVRTDACRPARPVGENAAMTATGPAHDWDSSYTGSSPPWDIGRPQPAFLRLADAGALTGALLDAGCGTGEHTILAARQRRRRPRHRRLPTRDRDRPAQGR